MKQPQRPWALRNKKTYKSIKVGRLQGEQLAKRGDNMHMHRDAWLQAELRVIVKSA